MKQFDKNEHTIVIEVKEENTFDYIGKNIYDDHSRLMVYFGGRYLYFNNEKNQISDVEIMNDAFDSSVSFVPWAGSKCIGYYTSTGRRSNFHSKPTPINQPVYKFEFTFFILKKTLGLVKTGGF